MNHSAADSMNQPGSVAVTCEHLPGRDPSMDDGADSALPSLEARILAVVEERMKTLQNRTVNTLVSVIAERLEPFIEKKVLERTAQAASPGLDANQLKDTVVSVLKSSLFDSGILEKYVDRVVSSRGGEGGGGGANAAQMAKIVEEKIAHAGSTIGTQCTEQIRKEIVTIAQKEAAATLSGENLKILIDDKFRAISLYLKTDVIPKTVAQILKSTKKPGAMG